jgi:hypothetical protein
VGWSSLGRGAAAASSWNPVWREGPRWSAMLGRCLPVTEGRIGCSDGDFLARERGSRRAPSVSMALRMTSRGERNGWGPGRTVMKRRRGGGSS